MLTWMFIAVVHACRPRWILFTVIKEGGLRSSHNKYYVITVKPASNNGLSKRWTTSVQRTNSMPPIALPMEVVHLEPPSSEHLSTPDNGQPECPQRTAICTK